MLLYLLGYVYLQLDEIYKEIFPSRCGIYIFIYILN